MTARRKPGKDTRTAKDRKPASTTDMEGDTSHATKTSPSKTAPAGSKKRAPAKSASGAAGKPGRTSRAAAKKPRRVSEKRQRANDALRLELHALRSELARIVEGFEVRVGGRINNMLRTLEGDESIGQPPRCLTTAQAQAALDEIAAVKLHSGKARVRDLRRIQRLTRRLRQRIPD